MKFFSFFIHLIFVAAHGHSLANHIGCFEKRERLLAQQSQTSLPLYVVQCKANGEYKEIQSDGFNYWCVDPVTGEKRPETKTRGEKPNCSVGKKIDCNYVKANQEAEHSSESPLVIASCKPDGSYEEKQCHEYVRGAVYCWCVHPVSGQPQPGTLTKGDNLKCNSTSH